MERRGLERPADDLEARRLVVAHGLHLLQGIEAPQERDAAARDDAFFDGGPRRVKRVLDARLFFFHFRLGGGADVHLGHAAGEFGQPFLEFFLVIVAGGGFDFAADLFDAALNGFGVAGALDDGRVVVVNNDLLGGAQVRQADFLQFHPKVLHDGLSAGEGGDVLEHGLAPVAVAGRLDGTDAEDAPQFVDDECREGLALDILGDDQQGPVRLAHLFQEGHQPLDVRNLLLVYEDERPLQHAFHAVGVRDEMGREVPAVELHPLDVVHGGLEALALLDRDDAVLAHLLERLGQHPADRRVAVGTDGADLDDLVALRDVDGLGEFRQVRDDGADGLLDPAGQGHRVGPGGDVPQGLAENGFGDDRGGGRPVAGHVARLRRRLLHQLGAHVLVLVLQFDLLGHRDAVFRDRRGAPAFVEDGVASARAQGGTDCAGEFFDARQQPTSRFLLEGQYFGCHCR